MNKILITTVLPFLLLLHAHAQMTPLKPMYGHSESGAFVQQILQKQFDQQRLANKGTALVDRLTDWSRYSIPAGQTTLALEDTVHYNYGSFSQRSELNNNVLATYQDLVYQPLFYIHPDVQNVSKSEFFSNLQTPSIQFDSAHYFSPGNNYHQWTSRSYVSGRLMRDVVKFSPNPSSTPYPVYDTFFHTYDAADRLVSSWGSPFSSGTTDLPSIFRTYNGNLILRDSFSAHHIYSADYRYDNSSNLTSVVLQKYNPNTSAWVFQSNDTFTYTASNKLQSHYSETFNPYNVSGIDKSIDSFWYQVNNLIRFSTFTAWNPLNSRYDNSITTTNYFDVSGNLDSQYNYTSNLGQITPTSKTTYSYTSFNHYDKIKTYNYRTNAFSATPDQVTNFYYQIFDPTAVNNLPTRNIGANIYPNPASNKLFVAFAEVPKTTVNIRIYNTAGQLVQSGTAQNVVTELSTKMLVPGNYIIEVSNMAGSQRQQFVKD